MYGLKHSTKFSNKTTILERSMNFGNVGLPNQLLTNHLNLRTFISSIFYSTEFGCINAGHIK